MAKLSCIDVRICYYQGEITIGGKEMLKSEARQSNGARIPYAAEKEKCMACGLCEKMCSDGCIDVEKEMEEK